MSNDPELLKKLIDDELETVELQKEGSREIVRGIAIDTSSVKRKKNPVRRAFLCCCKCMGITTAIFMFLSVVALGLAYSYFSGMVYQLTIETDSPQKFPVVRLPDAELEKIVDRVNIFMTAIEFEDEDIEDLVLTQGEINAFIGHSDYLRGNLMITLHKDLIVDEFSLPMDILGYNDRYFVGSEHLALKSEGEKDLLEMEMDIETQEDVFDGPLYFMQFHYLITKNKEDEGATMLELYLERGRFFGQDVSKEVIDQHENLLESLYDEDVIRDAINGIGSVSIEEGKVVVKARRFEHKN